MAGNSTVPTIGTSNTGHNLIWLYIIWISHFFFMSVPNLLVTLAVLRYSALRNRKEYLIVAGLSFTDFCYTLANSCAAIHRLYLIYSDQWTLTRSPWSCMMLPQNLLWSFAGPACGMMLVVISLDRFLAVAIPLKYLSMTVRYAYRMLCMVYVSTLFMAALLIGHGFVQRNENSTELAAPCFTVPPLLAISFNKYHTSFFMYGLSSGGMISVVLYVCVGVAYCKKKQLLIHPGTDHSTLQRERKLQKRLTKNLALSCLCTTMLLVVPHEVAIVSEGYMPRLFIQFLYLLPPWNPFCNIVIYYKRQPDLKREVLLFRPSGPNCDYIYKFLYTNHNNISPGGNGSQL